MARTTKAQVASAFTYFVQEVGGKVADQYNDVGGYTLDYNPTYGGYVIEQIANDGGGVKRPFGDKRQSAAHMYDTLWFATRALQSKSEAA